jgi:chemotaxis protein MotB
LKEIKEKIEQAMKQIPAFKDMQNQIKMTMTAEGLRIDLLETKRGLFFDTGNPKPTEAGGELLKVLASELMKLPTRSSSKAIPIPRPTAAPIIPTGNSRPIAPTRPGES